MTYGPKSGFIKTIILLIIGILVLSFFGINLKSVIESPLVQENFSYAKNATVYVWQNYLAGPVKYVWNKAIVDFLWVKVLDQVKETSVNMIENIENNSSNVLPAN